MVSLLTGFEGFYLERSLSTQNSFRRSDKRLWKSLCFTSKCFGIFRIQDWRSASFCSFDHYNTNSSVQEIPRNCSCKENAWHQEHGPRAWAIFSIFRLNQSDWWPIISLRLHKSSFYYKSKHLSFENLNFSSYINRSIKTSRLAKNRFLRIGQMIIKADSEQFRMNSV